MANDPNLSPPTPEQKLTLRDKAFLLFTAIGTGGTVYEAASGFFWMLTTEQKVSTTARVVGSIGLAIPTIASLFGLFLIIRGVIGFIQFSDKPSGKLFDFVMPPEDADHRAEAMDVAFCKWRLRYSLTTTWVLYGVHTLSTVALYYVDRIKRGK